MNLLLELSTLCCVTMGIYVLYMGDWAEMHLKRAAVMLGTTAALGFSYIVFFYPESTRCVAPDIVCASFGIYCLFKNIAVLIFQYACGRDALVRKQQKERGRRAWTTTRSFNNRERWRA